MSTHDHCARCLHARSHHHGAVRLDGSWQDDAGPCWARQCVEQEGAERCTSFVEPAKLAE